MSDRCSKCRCRVYYEDLDGEGLCRDCSPYGALLDRLDELEERVCFLESRLSAVEEGTDAC